MPNLDEWVKTQHAKGYSVEQLEQYLLKNGYKKEDVDKVLLNVMSGSIQNEKPKKLKLWIPILIVIILLVAGAMYHYGIFSTTITSSSKNNATWYFQQSLSSNCGEDMLCFITQSQSCERSSVQFNSALEIFGVVVNTSEYLEIKGMKNNSCVLYIREDNIVYTYTNATIQELLSQNVSMQEIQTQEQDIQNQSSSSIGKDEICSFKITDLSAMLSRWNQGTFSGGIDSDGKAAGDFENATCTGRMFESATNISN